MLEPVSLPKAGAGTDGGDPRVERIYNLELLCRDGLSAGGKADSGHQTS